MTLPDLSSIANYLQIIFINVVLSADNVVVIGMAAAGLTAALRPKAIAVGIAAAAVIRVVFSLVAVRLLAITGLLLAGGLLLLWVCWKMFEELRQAHGAAGDSGPEPDAPPGGLAPVARKTFGQAVGQIILADVSMSLDNVLAVAGAAQQDMMALVFGLILSVALMGLAASQLARLLERYRWIGWVGLAIIIYVAGNMIYEGTLELIP
jgi:YjbE family integral membrane protein